MQYLGSKLLLFKIVIKQLHKLGPDAPAKVVILLVLFGQFVFQ